MPIARQEEIRLPFWTGRELIGCRRAESLASWIGKKAFRRKGKLHEPCGTHRLWKWSNIIFKSLLHNSNLLTELS